MALEFLLLALYFCLVVTGIKTIPCWNQEDLQYFIFDQQVHIPTAVLGNPSLDSNNPVGHDLYMKLAKDSQGLYGVEVRKPIVEPTGTYCHVLKIASMDKEPEVITISTIWPDARVCIDAKLGNALNLRENGVSPIKSECTHEMMLTYGEERGHTVFRYSRAHLNGRRAIMEKVLSNLVDYFKTKEYQVAVHGPEPMGKDMQFFEMTWGSQSSSLAAILDMAISTSFIEKGLAFKVKRLPESTGIQFYQRTGKNDIRWVERHMKGFTFSFDKIAGATSRPYHDIVSLVTKLFIDRGTIIVNPDKRSGLHGYRIYLNLPIHADVQRLLYAYLYTITGPFYSNIALVKAYKHQPTKAFIIEIDTGKQYYKDFYDLFCQMAIDLSPEQFPTIGYNNAAIEDPITYFDFQEIDLEVGLLPRPKTTSSRLMDFHDIPDAGTYILGPGYETTSSKDKAGWENASYLTKNDYKVLGLPVSSDQQAKQKIRRMVVRFEREIMSASSDAEDSDLLGPLSNSDDEMEDSRSNPRMLFTKYSREMTQNQIAIEIIQQELSIIQKQVQECRFLKDCQQRLVIFELFSKVKKLMSSKIPEGACIIAELAIKNSLLTNALDDTGIEDISGVVKRAMIWLGVGKLDHTRPDYNGEDLLHVKSKEMRALFTKLLPHYQERNFNVPEATVFPKKPFPSIPNKVNLTQAMAKKEEAKELADHLKSLVLQFIEVRRESKDCMAAYREREFILVGNIFKKCLDDLSRFSGAQDIYTAATISDHPVRVRMNQLGISDVSLKQMSAFLAQYRNPAAHPPVDRFDQRALDMDSEDDIRRLIADFKVLKANIDRINEIFKV